MGRKWKRNRKNKHTGEGKPRKPSEPWKYGEERDPYKLIAHGNYKMEAYYAYQVSKEHF